MSTLLIGYGNTLRGDDALGVRVAELVGERHPSLDVRLVQQLTPELAEPIASSDLSIFVDARVDRQDQGAIWERLAPTALKPAWLGHLGDPRALLALCQVLYGRWPEAWLVTVPARDCRMGIGLSPEARRGMPLWVQTVSARLDAAGALGAP